MSEQVTEYLVSRGELLRAEDMKPSDVYRLVDAQDHHALQERIDALHAEAEALRAENWRLREERDSFQREGIRAMEELEAARGLLREAAEDIESWGAYASAYFQEKHDLAGCAMKYRMAGTGDQEDGGAEQAAIAAMPLTATPAPEALAEQAQCDRDLELFGVSFSVRGRRVDPADVTFRMKTQEVQAEQDEGEARHDAVKAIHDVMAAVPCSSLYSLAEAVFDAGYVKAAEQGEQQDCEWCAGAGHDHFGDKCAHCDTRIDQAGEWRIDTSAGREILVYKDCSVIEADDARYVIRLIAAEQGERQEAVAWTVAYPPEYKPFMYHLSFRSEVEAVRYAQQETPKAMGCIVLPLYTTPQPGPDVRGLVEALGWYEQQVAGCRKLTSEGDECRQALDSDGGKRAQTALAAHRQAQQGGSHDR